jgi:hypothetical protein
MLATVPLNSAGPEEVALYYLQRGVAMARLGHEPEAREALVAATRVSGVRLETWVAPHALFELGELEWRLGRDAVALAYYERAYRGYKGYDFDKPLQRRLQLRLNRGRYELGPKDDDPVLALPLEAASATGGGQQRGRGGSTASLGRGSRAPRVPGLRTGSTPSLQPAAGGSGNRGGGGLLLFAQRPLSSSSIAGSVRRRNSSSSTSSGGGGGGGGGVGGDNDDSFATASEGSSGRGSGSGSGSYDGNGDFIASGWGGNGSNNGNGLSDDGGGRSVAARSHRSAAHTAHSIASRTSHGSMVLVVDGFNTSQCTTSELAERRRPNGGHVGGHGGIPVGGAGRQPSGARKKQTLSAPRMILARNQLRAGSASSVVSAGSRRGAGGRGDPGGAENGSSNNNNNNNNTTTTNHSSSHGGDDDDDNNTDLSPLRRQRRPRRPTGSDDSTASSDDGYELPFSRRRRLGSALVLRSTIDADPGVDRGAHVIPHPESEEVSAEARAEALLDVEELLGSIRDESSGLIPLSHCTAFPTRTGGTRAAMISKLRPSPATCARPRIGHGGLPVFTGSELIDWVSRAVPSLSRDDAARLAAWMRAARVLLRYPPIRLELEDHWERGDGFGVEASVVEDSDKMLYTLREFVVPPCLNLYHPWTQPRRRADVVALSLMARVVEMIDNYSLATPSAHRAAG